MSVIIDFSMDRGEDLVLTFQVAPPTNISNRPFQFQIGKRFGWTSGLVTKSMDSGYTTGQSGMTVQDGPNGIGTARINAPDVSGLEFGTYAYQIVSPLSGSRSVITEGFMLLNP